MRQHLILLVLLCLLAPARVLAATRESLYLLHGASEAALQELLGAGVVVSRVEGEDVFAYASEADRAVLDRAGCNLRVLEEETSGREHYRAHVDDPRRLSRLPAPVRCLDFDGERAILSVSARATDQVLGLGFELAKLFRTPLRLAPALQGSLPAGAWAGTASEARTESLVARVSTDTLNANVAALQAFGTRHAAKSGGRLAAQWIAAKFHSYGIADVQILEWSAGYAGNVVATIHGQVTPDYIYVLGGHYDSVALDSAFEPGADDNGSGTAAVMECARVMASYQFASTIRFIAFGGEELGLVGSEAYAYAAGLQAENILGMVNLDMVGYLAPGDTRDLNFIRNPASTWLGDAAQSAAARFVPELPFVRVKAMRGSSDHESFWRHGYPAIILHEDVSNQSPYLHTPEDIVGVSYNDPPLEAFATRLAAALVASLAGEPGVPVVVESFAARTAGAGIELEWQLAAAGGRELRGVEVQRAESARGPFESRSPLLPVGRGAGSFVDSGIHRGERYWYRLGLVGFATATAFSAAIEVVAGAEVTRSALLPASNAMTGQPVAIRYSIGPAAAAVRIAVYDVRGRFIRDLVAAPREPGEYLVSWDRHDASGSPVGRGLYLVQLRAGGATAAQKLVLARR